MEEKYERQGVVRLTQAPHLDFCIFNFGDAQCAWSLVNEKACCNQEVENQSVGEFQSLMYIVCPFLLIVASVDPQYALKWPAEH